MADWFKIDANIVYDPNLHFCLTKYQEAATIFLWCLGCCCRQQSDRFSWRNTPQEVHGASGSLAMQHDRFVAALSVMVETGLVELTDGQLIVKQWDKHQSEYLRRKSYFAGRYTKQSNNSSPKSTEKHREALKSTEKLSAFSLEERRGEERIREEKGEGEGNPPRHSIRSFEAPKVEELKLYAATIGLPESETKLFTAHYESNGWMVGSVPMVSWRDALMKWKIRFDANRNNQRQNARPARHVPNI